jgi:hypothetical protein
MEVGGEFHDSTALLTGKEPPVPTAQETVGAPKPFLIAYSIAELKSSSDKESSSFGPF